MELIAKILMFEHDYGWTIGVELNGKAHLKGSLCSEVNWINTKVIDAQSIGWDANTSKLSAGFTLLNRVNDELYFFSRI